MIISFPDNTRKVIRTQIGTRLSVSSLPLPLILLFQATISLLTLRNTAFQDEALYLLAGRQIFNSWIGQPHTLDPYGLYFSGYPAFYPVIGGMLDMLGGIEAARLFSLVCMLCVTASVYYMTVRFFGRNVALVASALYACQAPVMFLGRLATYDALCLMLLAFASILAIRVSKARAPWLALGIGPLLLLAVAAKYAGLLFVPSVFGILILTNLDKQGWRKTIVRTLLALLSLITISIIAVLTMDKNVITGLSFTTTNRVSIIKTAPLALLQHVVVLGGVVFLLALLGLFFVKRRHILFALLLFGTSLLAPTYHIYKGELVSLDKHIAFSMFFIVPLASLSVLHIASGFKSYRVVNRHFIAILAIYLLIFSLGLQQAQNIYSGWASSNDLTSLLRTQVRQAGGRYLVEDFDVSRYYLQGVSYPWQWNSLDFFSYMDKEHHQLLGNDAYKAAIHEGYFDLVELSYGYNAQLAYTIQSYMKTDGNYELVAKVPYRNAYGTGTYWLWRKHVVPSTT